MKYRRGFILQLKEHQILLNQTLTAEDENIDETLVRIETV